MKKLVIYILILSTVFSFAACASYNQPVSDVKALEQQVAVASLSKGSRPREFSEFYYLGTDNGYHIVWYRVKYYEQCDMSSIGNIEGYEFELGGPCNLKLYKDGELIDFSRAYYVDGLISKEAAINAGKLYAEQRNAAE